VLRATTAAIGCAGLAATDRQGHGHPDIPSRRGLGLHVGLEPHAMQRAMHLLRPAHRDLDPAGPVASLGIIAHIDDREAAEFLLGLDETACLCYRHRVLGGAR